MPRRPINKHAGIIVKVKKEKEEKEREQRKPLPNKQVNNFTVNVTLWGMRQKTTHFLSLCPERVVKDIRGMCIPTLLGGGGREQEDACLEHGY